MTPKVLVRSPLASYRETPFANAKPREKRRVGEMAGGAAAECTAVCCCCPLTVMDLLVLGLFKVPAGLCKKAIHKRKHKRQMKKMKNEAFLQQRANAGASEIENVQCTLEDHLSAETKKGTGEADKVEGVSDGGELEKEMWAQFSGAGFWRSLSQREPQSPGV